jgi:hypothetical protein
MNLPKTRDALIAAGYKFSNHAICRGPNCKAEIEWFETPRGKKMPFDLMPNGDSPAKPHWGTCPDRKDF